MKMIKVMMAALIVAAFTGCSSSDDNGSQTNGDLTARWNETKTVAKISGETYNNPYDQNETGCAKDFIEFKDDNTAVRTIYFHNGDNVCTEDSSTPVEYQHTGNQLIIGNGYYAGTYTVKKLTSNELVIESTDSTGSITTVTTIYFTKASM